MTPADAKALYDKQIEKDLDETIMKLVYQAIKEKIELHKKKSYDFDQLLIGILEKINGRPIRDYSEEIRSVLKTQGFQIVDHPDPDPGHPCSRPYTTLYFF